MNSDPFHEFTSALDRLVKAMARLVEQAIMHLLVRKPTEPAPPREKTPTLREALHHKPRKPTVHLPARRHHPRPRGHTRK